VAQEEVNVRRDRSGLIEGLDQFRERAVEPFGPGSHIRSIVNVDADHVRTETRPPLFLRAHRDSALVDDVTRVGSVCYWCGLGFIRSSRRPLVSLRFSKLRAPTRMLAGRRLVGNHRPQCSRLCARESVLAVLPISPSRAQRLLVLDPILITSNR
jgi:hypothetical protein